jgi:hypothetical protein
MPYVPQRRWLKNTLYLDVRPCKLVEIYQLLGGKYFLHLQGGIISQESKQRIAAYFIY